MIPYGDILKEVGIRLNAVKGATPELKEISLAANPLTAAQIGSVDFPFTTIQRNVLAGVARLVRSYANLKSHPFRNFNASQTASLASGAVIPSVNASNLPIVGAYGAITDATTGDLLTETPIQIIEPLIRSKADGSLRKDYFGYKIAGNRIYHTRDAVKIDVVTFDMAGELVKMNAASGLSPLADALYDLAFSAALALCVSDDAYFSQAQKYDSYVQGELVNMANGAITFKPAPEMVNTATPSVS
jgi:hypothetical protein